MQGLRVRIGEYADLRRARIVDAAIAEERRDGLRWVVSLPAMFAKMPVPHSSPSVT